MQISALLNIPPLFSVAEINAPLPNETGSAESSFRNVLESLLSTGRLPQPLGSFGLSVMAQTLYRYGNPCRHEYLTKQTLHRRCSGGRHFHKSSL